VTNYEPMLAFPRPCVGLQLKSVGVNVPRATYRIARRYREK
jgi:hypothetical protein